MYTTDVHESLTSRMDIQGIEQPARYADFSPLGQVCRAGLATRGNTHLTPTAIRRAIEAGINYLNWCSHADGMSEAVAAMDADERSRIFVASQFYARSAEAAERELQSQLDELATSYIDVVTYYYVEHESQWREIIAPGGAAEVLESARREGVVRSIGLTSHQRPLAAEIATSRRIDMLMVRYNAAHRGAEEQIFPVTRQLGMPVVTYTGLRWGHLLKPTPDDPSDFEPPAAPEWYQFVLCQPDVTVGLMAPDGDAELEEDLELLRKWRGLTIDEYQRLAAHGDRVRQHAGQFP